MKTFEEILNKTKYDYSFDDNEFPIRVFNESDVIIMLKEYATEAIKADRERIANIDTFVDPPLNMNNVSFSDCERHVILNLPIEFP